MALGELLGHSFPGKSSLVKLIYLPFHETSGPVQSVPQASEPVEFYGKLLDDRVMGIIIDETNR